MINQLLEISVETGKKTLIESTNLSLFITELRILEGLVCSAAPLLPYIALNLL